MDTNRMLETTTRCCEPYGVQPSEGNHILTRCQLVTWTGRRMTLFGDIKE
jgi:hypothetical protein